MKLEVISPQGIVVSKEITKISLPGAMGQFTILNNHAPIVTTLNKGKIAYYENGARSEVEISWAILSSKNNVINIYIEP